MMAGGTSEHRRRRDRARGRRDGDALVRWGGRSPRVRRVRGRVELEQVAGVVELRSAAGAEEPEVANLGEAARHHMLEEAPDEGVDREREAPRLLRARMGVGEGDALMVELLEPRIGERDVKYIPRQVADGMVAAPDLLDAATPFFSTGAPFKSAIRCPEPAPAETKTS